MWKMPIVWNRQLAIHEVSGSACFSSSGGERTRNESAEKKLFGGGAGKRRRHWQHAWRHTRPGCRIGNFLLFWISSSFCFPPFSCFPDMRWRGTAQEKSWSKKKKAFFTLRHFYQATFLKFGIAGKKIGPQNEKFPPTYQIFFIREMTGLREVQRCALKKIWKGEREGRGGIRKISMHSFLFASLFLDPWISRKFAQQIRKGDDVRKGHWNPSGSIEFMVTFTISFVVFHLPE